jgi:hypothetical protein
MVEGGGAKEKQKTHLNEKTSRAAGRKAHGRREVGVVSAAAGEVETCLHVTSRQHARDIKTTCT